MNSTQKQSAQTRFRSDGSCSTCAGGWLCKACQIDGLARDRARSAVLASAALGIHCNRIARVCARFELESDEGGTRSEKAAAMLVINPFLA